MINLHRNDYRIEWPLIALRRRNPSLERRRWSLALHQKCAISERKKITCALINRKKQDAKIEKSIRHTTPLIG